MQQRTPADRVSDAITRVAGSAAFVALHGVLFTVWITINVGEVRSVPIFDPYPFNFLTLVVSLEAIFLSIFVLMSQNRAARLGDRRAHLDLQIDLLAEREMTAVLQLLQDIARHLNVSTTVTSEQLRDLVTKTDVRSLTGRIEEFAEADALTE